MISINISISSRLQPICPGSLRVCNSTLAIANSALYWSLMPLCCHVIVISHCSCIGAIALRAPITAGITLMSTFLSHLISSHSGWYFSIFFISLSLMLVLFGTTCSMSIMIIYTIFIFVYVDNIWLSWLAITCLSVGGNPIVHSIFTVIFFNLF